jgi:hypothetical protein
VLRGLGAAPERPSRSASEVARRGGLSGSRLSSLVGSSVQDAPGQTAALSRSRSRGLACKPTSGEVLADLARVSIGAGHGGYKANDEHRRRALDPLRLALVNRGTSRSEGSIVGSIPIARCGPCKCTRTKNHLFAGLLQSPLTDSNRRPPPYHGSSAAVLAGTTGRSRSRSPCKSTFEACRQCHRMSPGVGADVPASYPRLVVCL